MSPRFYKKKFLWLYKTYKYRSLFKHTLLYMLIYIAYYNCIYSYINSTLQNQLRKPPYLSRWAYHLLWLSVLLFIFFYILIWMAPHRWNNIISLYISLYIYWTLYLLNLVPALVLHLGMLDQIQNDPEQSGARRVWGCTQQLENHSEQLFVCWKNKNIIITNRILQKIYFNLNIVERWCELVLHLFLFL